ncbi:G patch domain-containing protein 4 [Sabethes cyaneus]|uniref:G patch domain-containing protein 4 n=1 Tax=Sabethes cyaneus TaxID=53552 RepID=UPI00237E655F|nr:G patch domain-containing protein 4 [Sabethes cyaneus]
MDDYLGSVALPSMKQRQKKLCQAKMKPRADPVYKDSANFGVRMLEKLGWSEGKGLGKREDGMAAPILPKIKQDSEGFGYAGEKDDHWTQHDQDFNELLKSLNGEELPVGDVADTVKIKSLEEKSKSSRVRVHYKKFTRGKDLSRASEKDLANIFGKKSFQEVNEVLPDNEDDSAKSSLVEPEETNILGLTTINASVSVQDYFKNKMQSKNRKSCSTVEETPNLPKDCEDVACESAKQKKKKRKRSVENANAEQANTSVDQTKEKQSTEMELEDTKIEEKLNESATELAPKKKKKKRRLSIDNPNLVEHNRINDSESQANEVLSNGIGQNEVQKDSLKEKVEEDADALLVNNCTKKKKKKRRSSVDNSNLVEHRATDVVENQANKVLSYGLGQNEVHEDSLQEKLEENVDELIVSNGTKKKKKKRRLSVEKTKTVEQQVDGTYNEGLSNEHDEIYTASKKKSKKKDRELIEKKSVESYLLEQEVVPETVEPTQSKKKKSKKSYEQTDTPANNVSESDTNSAGVKEAEEPAVEKESEVVPETVEPKQSKKKKSKKSYEQTDTPANIVSDSDTTSAGVKEAEEPAVVDNRGEVDTKSDPDEDVTCRVKVNILKQLDEYAFPGSNFADIVGYGLTQDVKLVKRNSNRNQTLEKHQFIRLKQTSLQRKRQMLKKISAFEAI